MKKTTLILFLMGIAVSLTVAQHPAMYSHYMFNSLVINPAYTGNRGALSLTGLYRHQWAGFQGAPRTETLIAHSPLKDPKNNLGINIINDHLGQTYTTSIYGSYAYRIIGEKWRFAMGLQGGLSMRTDKWSKIDTNDPNDGAFANDSRLVFIPQVGFGTWLDSEKYYLGFSSPTLISYALGPNQVNQGSLKYIPWYLTGGTVITLNPVLKFKPSFLLKYLLNSPLQLDINANLIIKDSFWAGLSYRTGDAIVALFEYEINKQFRIGYSYDQSITKLANYNSGSHELVLRYEFGYNVKAMSPRYF